MFSFWVLLILTMYLAYMGWMYVNAGFMTLAYIAAVLFVIFYAVVSKIYHKRFYKGADWYFRRG